MNRSHVGQVQKWKPDLQQRQQEAVNSILGDGILCKCGSVAGARKGIVLLRCFDVIKQPGSDLAMQVLP